MMTKPSEQLYKDGIINYEQLKNINDFEINKPMSIHIRNIAISHEALELLSNSLSHNSSSNLRLDSTEKKEADLKKAIHEIQMQAEKLECHFDIEAMPGTKAEFIALLRTRYPKATFCSITDKAIQKHLKKLGIKFKRGVKPNKCPIFTKLTQIPDTSN